MVKHAALLHCIWEDHSLISTLCTAIMSLLMVFLSTFKHMSRQYLEKGQEHFLYTSFAVSYSLIIQLFDSIWPEQLIASLNKPQMNYTYCRLPHCNKR